MGLCQNLTFSEYGNVAYQIKAADTCSNMVANALPTNTPLTLGWSQKVKPFFLKVVMLHIKLKELSIEHHESKYLSLHTPAIPGWGQKVIYSFLSESGHVTYQIKVKEVKTNMQV